MSSYPPPYPPPPPPAPPYGADWRYQRRVLREQAKAQRDYMRAQRDQYRAQIRGLRRTSIVGPLLIVTIGVIFLLVQTGRLPAPHLWGWYARWWPLLLIGVGVVRLAEWMFDQTARRDLPPNTPYPRHVIGGGVVLILILLTGAGIAGSGLRHGGDEFFGHALSLNEDNLDEFLGDRHESDEPAVYACPANCAVTIDNPRGDVSVSGTSDDGKIHVQVHKLVYTRSDDEATRKARELAPRMSDAGGTVLLSMPSMEGAHADLTVTMPASTMLSVNANRGDVRVSAMKAALTLTANHGDVDCSGITGSIRGHINNGGSSFAAHSVTGQLSIEGRGRDVTLSDMSGPVEIAGEFFGTTHLEHIRGAIRFHTSRTDFQLARLDGEVEISPNADLSADEVVGPITLNTRNRNISIERASGDVSVTNRNGTVDVTSAPPMGNVTVENRNGTVNLTVPTDAGFVVQAETTNGELENDFSLTASGSEGHPKLSGTVNRGGPLVRITTSQGDVTVKKGSIAPLPPAPPAPPRITAAPDVNDAGTPAATAAKAAAKEAAAEVKAAQEEMRRAHREAVDAQKKARREGQQEPGPQ